MYSMGWPLITVTSARQKAWVDDGFMAKDGIGRTSHMDVKLLNAVRFAIESLLQVTDARHTKLTTSDARVMKCISHWQLSLTTLHAVRPYCTQQKMSRTMRSNRRLKRENG